MSGAENEAERAESRVSESGVVSGHSRKRLSRSGTWSWKPRSGAGSRGAERRAGIGRSESAHLYVHFRVMCEGTAYVYLCANLV